MGSGLVLCKYGLQDWFWDFLTCAPLSCSLQAPMEKFLDLKPKVNLPPLWIHRNLQQPSFLSGMRTTIPGRKGQLFTMWPKGCCLSFDPLLNWINSADRRRLEMDMLEKLLVVACDAALFYEYNYQPVVEEYRKKRRHSNLQSEHADKGK